MRKFGPYIVDANGFERSWNISSPDESICDVQDEATAHLLSAAPELLEALQGCLDCLDFESNEHIRRAALKAITKARQVEARQAEARQAEGNDDKT